MWVYIRSLSLLMIIKFSLSTEAEVSNDSVGLNLNNKHTLTSDSQKIQTYNNLTRNFQSRSFGGNISSDWNEDGHLSVKNFNNNNNVTATSIMTNIDYEEEIGGTPSIEEILEYIYPKSWTWALIFFHCVVFIVGLVGNCLVCIAVYRNRTMRTVTNYFIVNLAVADFLVILFCLPPSVVWDVTSTWWFGTAMCKTVLYLQVRCILKLPNYRHN